MEFAAAALTTIASGIGGVASAAAPLFTTASGFASILQGGATVASVLAAQRAGAAEGQKFELAAGDAETNILIEANRATEKRISLKQSLVNALGERDVAYAASGVDLSFGTPVAARRQAVADTERALAIEKSGSDLTVARLRERAASYRLAGVNAREGALAKAAGLGLSGAADILRRGVI